MIVKELYYSAILKALDEFEKVFQTDLDYRGVQSERVSESEVEIVIKQNNKDLQMRFVRKGRRVAVHSSYYDPGKGLKIHVEDFKINEDTSRIFTDIKTKLGVEKW